MNTHEVFSFHAPFVDDYLVSTLIPYYTHNVHKHEVYGSHGLLAYGQRERPSALLYNHTWYIHTVFDFHELLFDELPLIYPWQTSCHRSHT